MRHPSEATPVPGHGSRRSSNSPLPCRPGVRQWAVPEVTGCLVVVCDQNGIVRGLTGPAALLQRAGTAGFCPGATLAAGEAGANAVGLAMSLGRQAAVRGDEHHMAALQSWGAVAVPARCDGRVVGYASVWWDIVREPRADVIQHLLALGTAVCREKAAAAESQRLMCMLNGAAGPLQAHLVVDRTGLVLQATQSSMRLVGVDRGHDLSLSLPYMWQQIQKILAGGPPARIELRPPAVPGPCSVSLQVMADEPDLALVTVEAAGRREPSGSRQPAARYRFEDIITVSATMQAALHTAQSVAATDLPVLLLGESGTGKELVAQSIHRASGRSQGPFVAVNCAAFPRDLIVSELFGHEEGAFTGARRHGAPGRFEQAHGGTLFLDEIGEMALEHQAMLLRVLEEGHVVRLGGSMPRSADVRVVTATNRDLQEEVAGGRFRADLFYRLNVIAVHLPPLRERPDDIPVLAARFLEREARSLGRPLEWRPDAIRELRRHDWPGNVRELYNVVKRSAILATNGSVGPENLPWPRGSAPVPPGRRLQPREVEQVLDQAGGNVTAAARRLGVARSTVYRIRERANGPASP